MQENTQEPVTESPVETPINSPTSDSMSAKKDRGALYTPVAIVVAGLFISSGLYMGLATQGTAQVAGTAQAKQQAIDVKNIKTDGDAFIGQSSAPVVLVYWSDYQCPFCERFEIDVLPQIIDKYVSTGKLKIVFKDFPFLGSDSTDAALYAHAVWDLYPGSYFAWREAVFNSQDDEGDKGFGDAASIDQLIKSQFPQMDVAKVKAQVASKKDVYTQKIQTDLEQGQANGVTGTPGFVTGKQLISGAQPLVDFTQAIDAQLNK